MRTAIAVTLGLLVLASTFVRLSSDPGAPPGGDPDELAAAACEHLLGRFAEQIRGDAPAEAVLDELARAEATASAAAELDPTWVALAGAVGAVRESIEQDDPGAARIGMAVVTTECGRPDDAETTT